MTCSTISTGDRLTTT